MQTFKEFLVEGGNVTIGPISASRIKVGKGGRSRAETMLAVKGALHALHKSFFKEHGLHLFGKDAKALQTGSAFSGGSAHLVNPKISDADFEKYKKETSDIDVLVPAEHMNKLHAHLKPGTKCGEYTVEGVKKIGTEHHALMKHRKSGEVHQFDFGAAKYSRNEPTAYDRLAHSSDWADQQKGIPGAMTKILWGAISEKHKFSSKHGVGNRTGEPEWDNDIKTMGKKLFGDKADDTKAMGSFIGSAELIKKHIPADQHKRIFDKLVKDATERLSKHNPKGAEAGIKHLKRALNIK